jgi:hypothetical protein
VRRPNESRIVGIGGTTLVDPAGYAVDRYVTTAGAGEALPRRRHANVDEPMWTVAGMR